MKGLALVSIRKVSAGTKLITDDGFTCIGNHRERMVFRDKSDKGAFASVPQSSRFRLYVRCSDGRHYLDGQLSDDGKSYVGFWLKGSKK